MSTIERRAMYLDGTAGPVFSMWHVAPTARTTGRAALLLPLFFAYTGLRTQLGLLTDLHDWAVCAGLVATAVAGKLGAGMLAARWTGMSWRDSFSVGALMNTRGLIELIVLNLG